MYEDIDFDTIMDRMLDRIPDTMDKREGSIIYDALAPAAIELQQMYLQFDMLLQETFAATATREYLIKRAAERGITPYPASAATLKAVSTPTTVDIPIGSRFSLNELNYVIKKKDADGQYQVQCETTGIVGNQQFGNLIPIDYIDGLETIEMTELLIPGEDEEDDDSIRTRYFNTFDTKAYGGNIADYIEKTNAISGIGATKVTPVWKGGGTVLLTILDSDFNPASATLIKTAQDKIDPDPQGQGYGIAPIGHTVTVRTADAIKINVNCLITFQENYTFSGKQAEIEKVISAYLLEIRKTWANEKQSTVRISQIETRILNLEGVVDIQNTTLNGSTGNLLLSAYQIPVMGVISNG